MTRARLHPSCSSDLLRASGHDQGEELARRQSRYVSMRALLGPGKSRNVSHQLGAVENTETREADSDLIRQLDAHGAADSPSKRAPDATRLDLEQRHLDRREDFPRAPQKRAWPAHRRLTWTAGARSILCTESSRIEETQIKASCIVDGSARSRRRRAAPNAQSQKQIPESSPAGRRAANDSLSTSQPEPLSSAGWVIEE